MQMSDNVRKSKRLAAYAAAAAAVGFVQATNTVAVAETPKTPTTSSSSAVPKGVHATLWGDVWNGGEESDLLTIPRGGSDETMSEAETEVKPTSGKKKKKKKQKRNNKKDKNQKEEKSPFDTKSPFNGTNTPKAPSGSNTTTTSPPVSPKKQHHQQSTTNPMMKEILQQEDYYAILGLSQGEENASKIKKAYRRRAVQTHPDKTGGDRRAFDKLAEAYDVLLDDDKRALYNRFGKDGLDPTKGLGGGVGGEAYSPEDLFRSFFGGNPFSQSRQQPQQQPFRQRVNRNLRYQLEVTLEDLYRGMSRRVTVEAPSMMRGWYPSQHNHASKDVHVTIPRGRHAGQSIVLSGEMDFDSQDSPPGDLVFELHQRPHKTFTRKGHDLAVQMKISFQEAICGCIRTIQHLDGRELVLESAKHDIKGEGSEKNGDNDETSSSPNVYIQTGDVQVLKGQGMPKNAQGTEFGDLYVQYVVELPKSGSTEHLSTSERIELARLLEKFENSKTNNARNKKHQQSKKQKGDSYTLQKASVRDFGRASGPVPSFDDEDEHHEHHGQHAHFNPFGGAHRQFFWSSSSSSGRSGGSPFFGQDNDFGAEDEHVQCRQM